ncbi:hypothetical protein RSA_07455 [Rickettsia philipii str. 364D]|uniref:Uncharacterized protein n=1 Tax=Rickettsia philipii (strain 364D) TaxID=481009 RepID=H6PW48_RICP3|nr:hypothetical protein RSA_07455 [Rickettsia philipii str. 364D]
MNNLLRNEGLRAEIERFSEFANILFLKLLSENNEKSCGIISKHNQTMILSVTLIAML